MFSLTSERPITHTHTRCITQRPLSFYITSACLLTGYLWLVVSLVFCPPCFPGALQPNLKKKRENGNTCRQPREDRPLWEFHCRKNERGRIMGGSTCVPCFMLPPFFLSKIFGFFLLLLLFKLKMCQLQTFQTQQGYARHMSWLLLTHTPNDFWRVVLDINEDIWSYISWWKFKDVWHSVVSFEVCFLFGIFFASIAVTLRLFQGNVGLSLERLLCPHTHMATSQCKTLTDAIKHVFNSQFKHRAAPLYESVHQLHSSQNQPWTAWVENYCVMKDNICTAAARKQWGFFVVVACLF